MQVVDRTIAEYSAWMKDVRKLTPTTIYFYEDTLRKFVDFVDGTPWHMVTAQMVEQFMARKRRGGKTPSPATMDRDRVSLGVFFKWLQGRGVITASPIIDVGVPKVRNRLPKALSDAELCQLIGVDREEPADRVWLGLGGFIGLRRHEMTGLEVAQVDVGRGEISQLMRKGRIPSNVEYEQLALAISEEIPALRWVAQSFLDELGKLHELRSAYDARFLLPWDEPATERVRIQCGLEDPELPNPGLLNKRLARICRRAGVQATVHSLRHTAATNLFRAGVPAPIIMDQLGHTSMDTTMIYLKTSGQLAQWRASRPAE